jgi:hypothetical protein
MAKATPASTTRARLLTPRQFRWRVLVLIGLGLVMIVWLFSGPPLPQALAYHDFADQRTLLGIPHCLNVISNVPFVLVGVLGLWQLRRLGCFLDAHERWPYRFFFIGIALTGLGSAYYHLDPGNERLLWDRLPMTLAFMGVFDAVVGERLGPGVGRALLAPLLLAGLASVLYWDWTEQQGHGDLRCYYVVQFFPMLALPFMLLVFPARYTHSSGFFFALGWYVAAKVCEHPLDGPIFDRSGCVSGHTLKHLAAVLAACAILLMLRARRPCSAGQV